MAVTRIEIKDREPYAGGKTFGETGAYEQLDGTVHFAVDPANPANSLITDLELAPRIDRLSQEVSPVLGEHKRVGQCLVQGF